MDPGAIFKVLKPYAAKLCRVGHEAESLSPWLQLELKQRGLPAICVVVVKGAERLYLLSEQFTLLRTERATVREFTSFVMANR